ncbi:MAG: vancomycin high temperature exclusion protein [Anaerotignum sp.]
MKRMKVWVKRAMICLFCLGMVGILTVFGLSSYMKNHTGERILSAEEAADMDADCILILGCGVQEDGTPSLMLGDRLETGIALYEAGAAEKLLMSGDHGRKEYDEVNTMKDFAMERGIPSEDIFMDHAGFSTYDSMYRVRDVFCAEKVIIVTQAYHLPRALYVAEKLGLEAYGVAALDVNYHGQMYRELREMLARAKDFCSAWLQPAPKYLGEAIPVSGNGDLTND